MLSPLAAATAAPAQSLVAQCGFDRHCGGRCRRRRWPSGRRARQERVRAIRGGDGQDGVLVVQVAGAPCAFGPVHRALAGEAVDVDHPQPDSPVVVELVDGLLHVASLRTVQHACVVGDVAGQPERWCAACGGRQQDPGGQDREDQAEQAGDAHDRQCSATAGPGHPVPAKTPGRLCVGGDEQATHTTSSTGSGWWSSRRRVPRCQVRAPNIAPISPGTGRGCCTAPRCAGWPTRRRSSGRARATPRAPG